MNLSPRPPPSFPERLVEYVLFTSRWLLAPIYLGLVAGLAVLLVKFLQHTVELITHVLTTDGDDAIVGVLGLIDLALMGSLVVMVMFAGYETSCRNWNWPATRTSRAGWGKPISATSSSS
jgi:uncharacterized protein (TIGR00645 family)